MTEFAFEIDPKVSFGFDADGSVYLPSAPRQEPQADDSEPLPRWDHPSSDQVSTLAETIGKNANIIPNVKIDMDGRQKKNINLLARTLYVAGERMVAEAIWNLWPEGMNASGTVSNNITEPTERGRVFRAGLRPPVSQIQAYMRTEEFRTGMQLFGIEVDESDTGLTAEQQGLLTILSNYADNRDLKRKLGHAGISWAKYQVWLSQPVFRSFHDKLVGTALKQAIPMAQQQLAAKMVAGDLTAIKYGFEVSGHHDPNGKKQVDAQQLLAILLEVIEEEVKDPNILRNIAAKAQVRGIKAIEG